MSDTYPDPIQGANSPFAKTFSYEPMPYHPTAAVPTISLRDYFAAAALNGLLGNNEFHVDTDVESEIPNAIAKHAYEAADAMLKERAMNQ